MESPVTSSDQAGHDDDDSAVIDIKRDPAFLRVYADETVVIFRGSTIEISLLASGPDPDGIRVQTDKTGRVEQMIHTRLRPSYTELARVRLTPSQGVSLAMEILARGVERDQIDIENVSNALNAIASARTSGNEAVGGEAEQG